MDTRKLIDENSLTHFPDVFAPFITQNLNVKQKPSFDGLTMSCKGSRSCGNTTFALFSNTKMVQTLSRSLSKSFQL